MRRERKLGTRMYTLALREQRNMGLNASDALHCTLRWKDSGLTYKDVDRSFSEGGGRELHVFCMKA